MTCETLLRDLDHATALRLRGIPDRRDRRAFLEDVEREALRHQDDPAHLSDLLQRVKGGGR